MLTLKNIKKIYEQGDEAVLYDINLTFNKNEFVSILGCSGAGKSTLLNIIGGLDDKTSGKLLINGKDIYKRDDLNLDYYRKNNVGFIFQNYNLIEHLTVYENVMLPLLLTNSKKKHKRVLKILDKTGLKGKKNSKICDLSGGQKQRVAISRALINNPDIILADEPTGALDYKTGYEIMNLIKKLSKNKLVIMVTHNKVLAKKYSSRIIYLDKGRVISDTNPSKEKNEYFSTKFKRAERYKDEILEEIPEVDEVLGTTAYDKILDAVDAALEGNQEVILSDIDALPLPETKRLVTTGGHFAYLKIAEGCDKHCTYCIIPKVRGNYRSVPMERLVNEARELAEQGVKELILVAQETTLYGKDLYGEKSLHKLVRELCNISGIRWIRILYCYPEEITDELIQVMKEEPKVCHYLDLPIQHANDTILKRMGRRTTKQELVNIVEKLRSEIPDICLRTTLITGFPGETAEQHEELMQFVDEMEFDRLGVFTYSPEEDTPAAGMPEQIEEEVKEDRQAEIMELQQEIAFDKAEDMIGREVLVMIEGKVADENAYVGRTYRDAPNVDGLIFINTNEELLSGDFARVKVTGALDYDLIGELL